MNELHEYIERYSTRGACQCGTCFDAPETPEDHQPNGHTADVVFFKVAKQNNPDSNAFLALVEKYAPSLLDGKEHSYLQVGGMVGDQGTALTLMALGSLLGIWKLLTPAIMGIQSDDPLAKQMAGMGFVSIVKQ